MLNNFFKKKCRLWDKHTMCAIPTARNTGKWTGSTDKTSERRKHEGKT